MRKKIGGAVYELVVASDVTRDGLGLECWTEDEEELLCEFFWYDGPDKLVFTAHRTELPAELIEALAPIAREKLTPDRRRGPGNHWRQ